MGFSCMRGQKKCGSLLMSVKRTNHFGVVKPKLLNCSKNLISNVLVVGCRTIWFDFQWPGSDIFVPGIWLGISVLF